MITKNICGSCGGDMRYLGRFKFEEGHGGEIRKMYQCKKCKDIEFTIVDIYLC